MKKLLLAILLLPLLSTAQPLKEPIPPPPPPDTEVVAPQVFTFVEQMPQFPGGEAEMLKFLRTNITYPDLARTCGLQGTIFLAFVVNEDGSLTNVKVLRGIKCNTEDYKPGSKEATINCCDGAKLMDEEGLRVIRLMPKWEPGKQNGKPVKVQYNLPIKYTLR